MARSRLQLVFDLNALGLRTPTGAWNSSNAEAFLRYLQSKQQAIYGFQLGNEPGHYLTAAGVPTVAEHAKDYFAFRSLLTSLDWNTGQGHPLLIGPDVCFTDGPMGPPPGGVGKCANITYFEQLLRMTNRTIDLVTVHSYGLTGAQPGNIGQCTLDDFLSPDLWEVRGKTTLQPWMAVTRAVYGPDAKLILGETGTAGRGGCTNLSNTFAAGFFYVDQLGLAAALGYWQVFRQDLVGWSGEGTTSSYALAGDPGWGGATPLLPNPDFFTTRLWRRLVGPIILNASLVADAGIGVRVHAACGTARKGEVLLSWINPTSVQQSLTLLAPLHATPRDEYVLTAYNSELTSRNVCLNGATDFLTVESPMPPRVVDTSADPSIRLPPHAYGFFVLTGAGFPVCNY